MFCYSKRLYGAIGIQQHLKVQHKTFPQMYNLKDHIFKTMYQLPQFSGAFQ